MAAAQLLPALSCCCLAERCWEGGKNKKKKKKTAKLKTRERNLIVVVVVEMPAEKESL